MNNNYFYLLLIIAMVISGCIRPNMYDKAYRTNMLREMYPPEITSREDIHKKIESKPVLLERRPVAGWKNHGDISMAQNIQEIEKTSSKEIQYVEMYLLPDPKSSFDFFSLCRIWFYYDSRDKIVDLEWVYQSD